MVGIPAVHRFLAEKKNEKIQKRERQGMKFQVFFSLFICPGTIFYAITMS
jgi:hypothetical protein